MPLSRKRKKPTVENRKSGWWVRNRRSVLDGVDSGVTAVCLPLVAAIVIVPLIAIAQEKF